MVAPDEIPVDTVIDIRVDAVIADIAAGRVSREAATRIMTECCRWLAKQPADIRPVIRPDILV